MPAWYSFSFSSIVQSDLWDNVIRAVYTYQYCSYIEMRHKMRYMYWETLYKEVVVQPSWAHICGHSKQHSLQVVLDYGCCKLFILTYQFDSLVTSTSVMEARKG